MQRYTFSLASAARLHFDSRTNSNLRWSLDGPTGNLVNNRGFNSSDSINFGSPILSAQPGDYTLTVSGGADTVGNFHFRLFNLATAAALTPGTPVSSGVVPANASVAYQFTLGAAGRYFYDPQGVTGFPNGSVRLVDAYGNFYLNGNLNTDVGPLALPAGTYLLILEGYHSDVGNGSFTFNLNPVNDATQALPLGSLVVGSVSTPGQSQRYTFTLGAPSRLNFDSMTNNGSLRWSLEGPTGNLVNTRGFTSSDSINFGSPVLYLPAGNYTLSVSGNSDTVGGFHFRLTDLATVPSLSPGTPIVSTLSPANETDAYQFTVATSGRYFYNAQSISNLPNASVRLVDDYGNFYINGNLSTGHRPVHPAGGSLHPSSRRLFWRC